MRRRFHRFLPVLAALALGLMSWAPGVRAADIPAFPGAEGFGAETPGGRGGRLLEVTNLDDSGHGSLRAAIETEGPRIIVFRVAGTIAVDTPLQVLHPFVTIAGQSAPGGGITLKNSDRNYYAPLQVKTHDVVLRHHRFRPGVGASRRRTWKAPTLTH